MKKNSRQEYIDENSNCLLINRFFSSKNLLNFFLKQFARVLKSKKRKKINLSTIKNVRNGNYFDAINLIE